MSRIGNKPVPIPSGVKITLSDRTVSVQGPKGTLTYTHRPEVSVTIDEDAKQVTVSRRNDEKPSKAYHGLTRALINNMVQGVTEGFRRDLEINGVGWNAKVQGRKINLTVGYADTRVVDIPMGVEVDVQGNKVAVTGLDKQAVGQLAARIRSHRPPEPYNLKGIKYVDEQVTRKEGKAFGAGG